MCVDIDAAKSRTYLSPTQQVIKAQRRILESALLNLRRRGGRSGLIGDLLCVQHASCAEGFQISTRTSIEMCCAEEP